MSTKESIIILKNAQDLDSELYHALEQIHEILPEREKNKLSLEAEKSRLLELEASFKKVQLVQKEKEGSLAQKEANIKKLDGQLSQLKTNKDYQTMQQEIASLKADNSLLEEEIIRLMDEVEAVQVEIKKEKERLKQCEKEYEQKEKELSQKEAQFNQRAAELKMKKEDILKQLDPEVRDLYERIVEKKRGLALVKIAGEVCAACQIKLRPQLINEVQLGEKLVLCENCSRILYVEA